MDNEEKKAESKKWNVSQDFSFLAYHIKGYLKAYKYIVT